MSTLHDIDPQRGDRASCEAVDIVVVPRAHDIGDGFMVRRALPAAGRRMVGPFIFLDQMGPALLPPGKGIDVLPHPLVEVPLRYPEDAAKRDVSGRVVLLLLIDELGMVVEANVISAEPAGVFEEAALESFRHVQFSPAQRNGRVVKSRLPVEVTFDPKVESMKR